MPAIAAIDVVHLHSHDNIVVAARLLEPGETIEVVGRSITIAEMIRMGHKVAIAPIARGQRVLKYGQQIGVTTAAVEPGQWVHCHNLMNSAGERDFAPCSETPPDPRPVTDRTFLGYRRAGGRAGTRNYLAVISTVNCSASVAKYVARRFDESMLRDFPNIDGVFAITHGSGCGIQYRGSAHETLNRTLAGIAKHPNIGGFLLIGLGCEQGAMGYLLESQGLVQINGQPAKRSGPPVLSMQDMGGTLKTVEEGVRQLAALMPQANAVRRVPIPASEIVLGTNCGGSDGNSGVTANPALGVASDLIVACGGTSILAETPEIYGAEHLLTRRAKTPQAAQKLLDRIEWWKWYTGVFGADMDNNPSVGNKEGGLTTIAEKSLGAVAKAGSTAMMEVYDYSEPVTAKGFVVMDTPGFDPASVTGIVAGGANVVVFTTGRGSCFGCKPAPSIKVATNTPMYERMIDDMDINAGVILEGASVRKVGEQIFEELLAVASGKKTKSEIYSVGDEEFVPWLPGPML
jgi:altronate hydrolase